MYDRPSLSPSHRARLTTVVPVVLACAGGAALRVSYAFQGGLWRDEAQALGIAGIPSLEAMIEFLSHHESHPPLYFFMLRGWIHLFGASDAAALALPLLFGIILIPATFFIGNRLHSARVGVLAAIFVGVHPGLIRYAGTVRPYSLLSLLTVLLLWSLYMSLKGDHRTRWVTGYAAIAAAMVYTHHWAWLVVASGGLLWLAIGGSQRGTREVGVVAGVHAAVLLAYVPWASSLFRQLATAGHPPSTGSMAATALDAVMAITWLPSPSTVALLVIPAIGLFLVRSHAATSSSKTPLMLAAGIPGISALLTVFLLPIANLTSLWCYSIVIPPYLLCLATLIGQREIGRRGLVAAALQVTWVVVMVIVWRMVDSAPRANTRAIAHRIQSEIGSSDRLIVLPGYVVPSFFRYFGPWERSTSLPEDTLATHIPFDMRLARDLDPRPWMRMLAIMDSSRIECSRVWFVVEAGVPPHMQSLVSRLLEEANVRLGPHETWGGGPPPGVIEHVMVRRHDPCSVAPLSRAQPVPRRTAPP